MPIKSGIQATIEIRSRFASARILMLTAYDGDEDIYKALQAGAQGYVFKNSSVEKLIPALRAVLAGQRWIPKEVASRLASRKTFDNLTSREVQVLQELAKGLANKEIAATLNLSERTVKFHVSSLLAKFRVRGRMELVREASRHTPGAVPLTLATREERSYPAVAKGYSPTQRPVAVADGQPGDAMPQPAAAGELTARFYVWRYISSREPLEKAGLTTGLGDDWIRLGALKILSDGSMGSGTAAFFDPYTDDPKTSGLLLYPVPELARLIREADAAGFQLAVHAIGDRANSLVLDAFEKAAAANPPRERRFRIEHAQVVRKADLARYKRLGVIASIQPSHAIDDMRWAERRIGKERARESYNVRSFTAAGIPVAFGTDWFVEPLDPRLGLYAAITRERPEGGPPGGWFPEEKISLEEALDLYTRGSAYAEFAEKQKGTLAPGMLADLVVFADDLLRVAPRQILTTPVDLTVAGGRVVFDRAAGEAGNSR